MQITKHAAIRMQQRGISRSDVDLIVKYGRKVRDGYFLGKRDSVRAAKAIKKAQAQRVAIKDALQKLDKLAGKYVVLSKDFDSVISVYPLTRKRKRRWVLHT